jgi:hypothetical protein
LLILLSICYLQVSATPHDGTGEEGSLPPQPSQDGTEEEGSLPPQPSQDGTGEEGSLPPEGNAECNELNIRDITASGFETDPSDYHPPSDAIDKNPSTWWSNKDENSWLQIDLGKMNTICELSVQWNKGDTRKYTFLIEVSENGLDFEDVFKGTNKLGSSSLEVYPIEEIEAQYIKLAITGTSSKQGWVSIKEIKLTGRPNA